MLSLQVDLTQELTEVDTERRLQLRRGVIY